VARRAAGRLEKLFSMDGVPGNSAACRGRVVEQVPLDDVEVAFGDFLAVAVAIRIILADSRGSLDASAILQRFGNELPRAGVGNQPESVTTEAGERGWVASLQPRMNVKRRGRECP